MTPSIARDVVDVDSVLHGAVRLLVNWSGVAQSIESQYPTTEEMVRSSSE